MSNQRDVRREDEPGPKKRTRMVRQYPVHSLEDAMAIATGIQEVNAGLPFDRVLLAKVLGTTPASSGFTMKLNSSAKYGLTQGGYNDERITLTSRGESIAVPKQSGERRQALLEAALQPELFRSFYEALDGKRLPEDEYARNMLQREHGVQPGLTAECLQIIKVNGLFVGMLGEVSGSLYVSLSGAHAPPEQADEAGLPGPDQSSDAHSPVAVGMQRQDQIQRGHGGRIFLGHAGGEDVMSFLRHTLESFGIECGALDTEEGGQHSFSEEASRLMRSCEAAVLVLAWPPSVPEDGRLEARLNEKMIFMLGSASALYGDRIVLLREKDLEPVPQESSFHTLQFRRDNLEGLGLRLLQELHRLQVIQVRI